MPSFTSVSLDAASFSEHAHEHVGHQYIANAGDSFGFIEEVAGGLSGAAAGGATFTDVAVSGLYLGRYRRGDFVPLAFSTGSIPDAPPIAIVLDASSTQRYAAMLPASDRTRRAFAGKLYIDLGYEPGSFSVYYHSVVAGTTTLNLGSFDVVPGGDSGGSVISLYSLDRAEVRCVIAQLEDGHLVVGRNPATTA